MEAEYRTIGYQKENIFSQLNEVRNSKLTSFGIMPEKTEDGKSKISLMFEGKTIEIEVESEFLYRHSIMEKIKD